MDLSVIIVTYNSARHLPGCLGALFRTDKGLRFEVIAVDNASGDNTIRVLQQHIPSERIIANRENLGFSRAVNLGFQRARGRFVLLLNPDAEVQDAALERSVAYLGDHPEIGILGARVNNPNGTLQRACRRSIPTPQVAFFELSGLGRIWRNHPAAGAYNLADTDPDVIARVEAVSGSYLMVRRDVVDKVGGMDERFFLYGEDLDFCLSVTRAGYHIVYYPEAVVVHHKGASSRQALRAANREFHRAMSLFHEKHFAADTPAWLNHLIVGGIAVRRTILDLEFQLGLRSHVGTKG